MWSVEFCFILKLLNYIFYDALGNLWLSEEVLRCDHLLLKVEMVLLKNQSHRESIDYLSLKDSPDLPLFFVFFCT